MKKNKNKYWLILSFALLITIGFGIKSNAQSSVFYIGHSLSDQIGEMVKSMIEQSESTTFKLGYQSIPGASLHYQWDRKAANDYAPIPPFLYGFYDPVNGLPSSKYETLVLTESVPRQAQTEWGIKDTYKYTDSFYVFAKISNPNIRVLFYEVWHCLNSGTPTGCMYDIDSNPWRQRLTDDLPMWESVVTKLNETYKPINPVCMIPGGQGLARLHDEIAAGTIPGITDIKSLFGDDIHLKDQGKYFIACIHYAVLTGKSPVGLPVQLKNIWGGNFNAPTAQQARRFQEIAWETVRNYPKNCLSGSSSTTQNQSIQFTIYPNPASDEIFLQYEGEGKSTKLYNSLGQLLLKTKDKTISVRQIPAGLIFVEIEGRTEKFFKL